MKQGGRYHQPLLWGTNNFTFDVVANARGGTSCWIWEQFNTDFSMPEKLLCICERIIVAPVRYTHTHTHTLYTISPGFIISRLLGIPVSPGTDHVVVNFANGGGDAFMAEWGHIAARIAVQRAPAAPAADRPLERAAQEARQAEVRLFVLDCVWDWSLCGCWNENNTMCWKTPECAEIWEQSKICHNRLELANQFAHTAFYCSAHARMSRPSDCIIITMLIPLHCPSWMIIMCSFRIPLRLCSSTGRRSCRRCVWWFGDTHDLFGWEWGRVRSLFFVLFCYFATEKIVESELSTVFSHVARTSRYKCHAVSSSVQVVQWFSLLHTFYHLLATSVRLKLDGGLYPVCFVPDTFAICN